MKKETEEATDEVCLLNWYAVPHRVWNQQIDAMGDGEMIPRMRKLNRNHMCGVDFVMVSRIPSFSYFNDLIGVITYKCQLFFLDVLIFTHTLITKEILFTAESNFTTKEMCVVYHSSLAQTDCEVMT